MTSVPPLHSLNQTTPRLLLAFALGCSAACAPTQEPGASCTVTTDDAGIAFIRCPDGSDSLLGPVVRDSEDEPAEEQEEEPPLDSGSPSTEDPSVLVGSVVIENEYDLEALSGYSVITGDLTIRQTPLTSLDGLESLETVGGDLRIQYNPSLTSLDGLQRLTDVVGTVRISGNDALASLEGLEQLSTIGYELSLTENPLLPNLQGLNGLITVPRLKIRDHDQLVSLSGLDSLESVLYTFNVIENPNLSSLSGLNALTTAGSVSVYQCDLITDFQGLESLTSLSGLYIYGNPLLSSFDGLSNLTTLETLNINGVSSLCETTVTLFQAQLTVNSAIINLDEASCE